MKKKKKGKGDKPDRWVKLVLNITSPVKMDMELDLNQLGVFVGANASGKSLILKIMYAMGTISMSQGGPMGPIDTAQFVFDNTFTEQNFDGSLKAISNTGSVTVELSKGKVVSAEVKDMDKPIPVVFLSSDMRTFSSMSLYLRTRKMGGAAIELMKTLLGAYRLYDVTYMESLIRRCPIKLPEAVQKTLKSFDFEESIQSIDADLDKCTFFATMEDGSKKDVATYGNGHQAMLNMVIGVGA